MGEHTREILAEAGLSEDEIQDRDFNPGGHGEWSEATSCSVPSSSAPHSASR